MQIAPELMGQDGLPPPSSSSATAPPASSTEQSNNNKRRSTEFEDATGQQAAGSYGGGFQSSAARDEGNREWLTYEQAANRNMHPWEDGYRDENLVAALQETEEQEPAEESSKPRKRPRASKPRMSKSKENTINGLEVGFEYDYEDPSSDYKAGVVFRHPKPGAAPQACERCHKIKRKCDNARPRCAGCSKADEPCVFDLSPATSGYIHQLKSENIILTSQISSAHDRINHLEAVVSALEKGLPPPQMPASDLDPTQTDFAALARTVLSVRSATNNLASAYETLDSRTGGNNLGASSGAPSSPTEAAVLPPYDIARAAAEAFFIANAISYPFINKDEFLSDMTDLYAREGKSWNRHSDSDMLRGKEFTFFMVIAIGTTNRERVGEAVRGASKEFRQRAMRGLPYAVAREDMLCVQSLLLLGIYSMFDPSDMSLWHIVGFATRVAIALNLHRKNEDVNVSSEVAEIRRRVFYSLYNVERLVATTLSRPLVISDDDIDIELPSPLPNDPPYRGVAQMLFTQHIIKLRRLSGAICATVYSVSGSQNSLPEAQRNEIITNFHRQMDTWLAESPVPPSEETEKPGMINNQSWFLLNYHHNLCLLYRPSPLYPNMTTERLSALHDASSRCVALWMELFHEQKISYSIINVSAQFLDCISLLYCMCEYDNRSPNLHSDENWSREVSTRLGQCHALLEAFGRALPETAKYKEIFTKLSEMLLHRHGPLPDTSSILPAPNQDGSAPVSSSAQGSSSTGFDLQNVELLSPVYPSQDPRQNSATSEEQAAWNAMTQLWHNAGDFNFDESILGQIQDDRLAQLGLGGAIKGDSGMNGQGGSIGTAVDGQAAGNPPLQNGGWNADSILWSQIG
ncbi:fungal-specific transcription factor domain-domain-containing protein [Kockovaella imperatae]|uniref:Fungal-specific transcription factor domain-domain-containing protein n=1 Tax=Kockovaella imperatae TaxID=4999 RepID=A0A1Y1UD13_9TREE|nr:fungal-specific transcription factor domain-domain-containing protein [Kockovaella imperatae]ORX35941.1 fungal-specific transcription factor domain-domain-containing protein [Kockovaella imperatae]